MHISSTRPFLNNPVLSTSYGLLYEMDCLKFFPAVRDESVDCVFADPPFNLGKVYGCGEVNDALGTDEYLQWSPAWLKECIRVLKPGAALFVYIIPRWGYHFASYLEAQGMLFRHWIAVSMKGTFPRGQKLYPAHYALLIGVEIQFSARSDLLVIDIIHLRQAITAGEIDVGILVVPNDRLSRFLTDRGPSMADAKRHVGAARAEDLPFLPLSTNSPTPLVMRRRESLPRTILPKNTSPMVRDFPRLKDHLARFS